MVQPQILTLIFTPGDQPGHPESVGEPGAEGGLWLESGLESRPDRGGEGGLLWHASAQVGQICPACTNTGWHKNVRNMGLKTENLII